jgi:5'-nucleotidase (lipoprotein e(P4) family)
VRKGITYDQEDWFKWVDESAAKPIAGAAEFLAYLQSRGVTPFYITNRLAREEAGTRRNLERLQYPLTGEDNLFTRGERKEWESSDKGPRRDWVAERYRVLAVLGDDLNDFETAHESTIEARDAIVRDHAADWGTRWFILPNPMYGSWERAITGSSKGCEALQKKIEALRP